MLDSNDLTQAEYENLNTISEVYDEDEVHEVHNVTINIPPKDPYEGFVERKPLYDEKVFVFPTQKKLDLKNPALKNKGVRRKSNIVKDYEEANIEVETKNECFK